MKGRETRFLEKKERGSSNKGFFKKDKEKYKKINLPKNSEWKKI